MIPQLLVTSDIVELQAESVPPPAKDKGKKKVVQSEGVDMIAKMKWIRQSTKWMLVIYKGESFVPIPSWKSAE